MKTCRVTLSGGFHDADSLTIKVPCDKRSESVAMIDYLNNVISDNQRKRLERHFCGVQGCTCGSWTRAMIEEA